MPRSTSGQKEALTAVSSLKRILGIPHHPTKRDEFMQDELHNPICHIYTPDAQSAELLGELLYRIAVMPKGAAYYDSNHPGHSQRDTIRVQPLEDGGYDSSMRVLQPERFAAKIKKVIAKHIAPEKGAGRSR